MRLNPSISRRDFIGKPAPPGYVAGVGRGATGFTTRSDLGPAREMASTSGHNKFSNRQEEADEESEYLNESNYDEFAGYKGSLFNKEDPYDEEDRDADKIYEEIDKHLDERGKALREKKRRMELELYRQEMPKIQLQFSDLKDDLKQVSELEWINIPESGDARNRKQRVGRPDKYTPIPESLLAEQAKLASGGETLLSIDPRTAHHPNDDPVDDDEDNSISRDLIDNDKKKVSFKLEPTSSGVLNLGDMNEARSSIISTTLSRASNRVTPTNTTDHESYLGKLNSSEKVKVDENLDERRKQFETMLKVTNDPSVRAKVYLMYIELEDSAGKLSNARSLASKACSECPNCVELWCEAVRLQPRDKARELMISALRAQPRSLKLWLKAAELETDEDNKRKVFEKATHVIPQEPDVWRKLADLQPPFEAHRGVVLEQAIAKCPNVIDLWLSLARMKGSIESAMNVLQRATQKNPSNRSVRIEAAKVYERHGRSNQVHDIISRLVEAFKNSGVEIVRDEWFEDAVEAEHDGFPTTACAIVRRLIVWDLGQIQGTALLDRLLADASKFVDQKATTCARQLYQCLVDLFCGQEEPINLRESAWIAWANFEKQNNNNEAVERVLRLAVSKADYCRQAQSLWLMLIEHVKTMDQSNNDKIEQVLNDALSSNLKSEKLSLAAFEYYFEIGNSKRARKILSDASMCQKSPALLMRAAELERSLANLDEAVRMLKVGISEFRNCPNFYSLLGQIEEERGHIKEAKEYYTTGLMASKTNIDLWIRLAKLREKTDTIPVARSTLEKARRFNDGVAILYVESAKLEVRAFLSRLKGSSGTMRRPDFAESLISEGIRKCKGQAEFASLEMMQKLLKDRKWDQCT